jgi:hypothetical protein
VPELGPKVWERRTDISVEAYGDIAELFRTLDRLPMMRDEELAAGESPNIAVRLHPDADVIWGDWYNQNNARARELGGFLGGFYIKLEAHVARFALILHVLTHPDDPRPMISAETMRDAIELGEYFRGQLDLFMPLLMREAVQTSTKSVGLRDRIIRIIRHQNLQREENGADYSSDDWSWVTRSTIYNGLRNIRKEVLQDELDTCISKGIILHRRRPTTTKPVDEYRLPDPVTSGENLQRKVSGEDSDFGIFRESPAADIPTSGHVENGRCVGDLDPDDVPW